MKKLMLVAVGCTALLLGGCASGPQPTLIAGSYYLVGDKTCAKASRGFNAPPNTIECFDRNNKYTGNRGPMQNWQLQQYAAQAQQSAAMAQMIQQNNATLNAQAAQSRQQAQTTVPAPGSYQQPNTYDHYACRNATDQITQCKQLN